MSKAETARNRARAQAIASAPSLGAFAVAVGQLGIDGAVRLCGTRDIPARVQEVWDVLGYRIDQLPTAEDVRLLLVGVEVKRRLVQARKNSDQSTLPQLVAGFCKLDEARKGLRVLRNYGARVELRPELGAI